MQTHFPDLTTRRARERLVTDLRALTRNAEHLLETAAEDVNDKANDARKRLNEVVERVRATCDDLQERSLASARVAAQQTDRVVRRHPYQSVGIAFGLGLLAGVLVRRK